MSGAQQARCNSVAAFMNRSISGWVICSSVRCRFFAGMGFLPADGLLPAQYIRRS
jgi:hypothetical protein